MIKYGLLVDECFFVNIDIFEGILSEYEVWVWVLDKVDQACKRQ